MLHIDEAVVAEHEAVLDDVLELPDVPGKAVPHEDLHDGRRDALNPLSSLGVEALNEVLYQVGNVLPALRERRNCQPDYGQAEVEVVPEAALAHQIG